MSPITYNHPQKWVQAAKEGSLVKKGRKERFVKGGNMGGSGQAGFSDS